MKGFHDIFSAIRGHSQLGIVTAVDDTGGAQTVNVTTADGANRAGVEVAHPFGFSSVPPADGAVTLVIEIGGDPANLLALPVSNPSARFGGLLAGEVALYGSDGSRLVIRQGGKVEIWGMDVELHAATVLIDATTSVTINTPMMTVSGDLTVGGNLADSHGSLDRLRAHYDAHVHGSSPTTSAPDAE